MRKLDDRQVDAAKWQFTWYHIVLLIVGMIPLLILLYDGYEKLLLRMLGGNFLLVFSLWILHRSPWFTRQPVRQYALLAATWLCLTLVYTVHRNNTYNSTHTIWGAIYAPFGMVFPFLPPMPLFVALYVAGKERFRSGSVWVKILLLVLVPLAVFGLLMGVWLMGVWHDSMKRIFYVYMRG
jgi:hypothetical protein